MQQVSSRTIMLFIEFSGIPIGCKTRLEIQNIFNLWEARTFRMSLELSLQKYSVGTPMVLGDYFAWIDFQDYYEYYYLESLI